MWYYSQNGDAPEVYPPEFQPEHARYAMRYGASMPVGTTNYGWCEVQENGEVTIGTHMTHHSVRDALERRTHGRCAMRHLQELKGIRLTTPCGSPVARDRLKQWKQKHGTNWPGGNVVLLDRQHGIVVPANDVVVFPCWSARPYCSRNAAWFEAGVIDKEKRRQQCAMLRKLVQMGKASIELEGRDIDEEKSSLRWQLTSLTVPPEGFELSLDEAAQYVADMSTHESRGILKVRWAKEVALYYELMSGQLNSSLLLHHQRMVRTEFLHFTEV